MTRTIILVDEPIKNDQRVQNTIAKYNNPIIIDYTKETINFSHPIFLLLSNSYSLLLTVLYSPIFWLTFYKKYRYCPRGFTSGIIATLRTQYKIKKITKKITKKYADITIKSIYANDLSCGQIGMNLAKEFKCNFIYDAHEIEFHRNRKNSFLRVAYDVIIEKKVVKQCTNLILVNKPAADIYVNLYNIQRRKIIIISNNHFTPYLNNALNAFKRDSKKTGIVYIGSGIGGRKLEDLHSLTKGMSNILYGFFLSRIPVYTTESNWEVGTINYLPEFLHLIQERHLLMWCCTEDICLSYKLSLPNKFFQAIAVGIPIIAYKDTYLAEIVQKYNIGYIYNDTNFDEILDALKDTDTYYSLLQSVASFQKKLFIDKLEL
jgi:glycosyltransferase involved in cell wall biosynthesis